MNPPRQSITIGTEERENESYADQLRIALPGVVAGSETLQLLEETLQVSKREVLEGTVRVSTRTEAFNEIAEIALDRKIVDVTRVAIGQLVDIAPAVRTEGDLTIVPVMEERYVVVKQLYLKEEVHIRHHIETTLAQIPVQLRRQVAVVERTDADGRAMIDDRQSQA